MIKGLIFLAIVLMFWSGFVLMLLDDRGCAGDIVAYKYKVVPCEPYWADQKPAFEPHYSVTEKHPDQRFINISGVTAEDITPLREVSEC